MPPLPSSKLTSLRRHTAEFVICLYLNGHSTSSADQLLAPCIPSGVRGLVQDGSRGDAFLRRGPPRDGPRDPMGGVEAGGLLAL